MLTRHWFLLAATLASGCKTASHPVDTAPPTAEASAADLQRLDAPRRDSTPDAPRDFWRPAGACLHAHNDYEHARPLLDALDHGACSVEADVFAVAGELLVAHDLEDTKPGRTLESLYLDPLRERIADQGGSVYGDGMQLQLLIDFKSEALATWEAVQQTLQRYQELLTRFEGGVRHDGPLLVVISGDRPLDALRAQTSRLAAADGRLAELDQPELVAISPLVSENWNTHIVWRPELGPFPANLRDKLDGIVAQVHGNGQLLRFWSTADDPAVWRVLVDAGVDLISVDDLGAARAFFDKR